MAAATYDKALARLLVHEGGYGNHPSDPGGPTNFGITIADYRKYVKPGASAADVRAMRAEDAKAIYRAHYWNAMRCDELPAGLDYALFDFGVNSGNSRAVKFLQRLLGLPADGRMTDATVAAARQRQAADLVARLCDARLGFLRQLKTWPVFGAGWGRRVAEVKAAALAIAAAPNRPKPASAPTRAQAGTVGGVAAGGVVAAQQAHQSGMRPAIVAAIVIVAVMLALGGWLVWRWHQRRRPAAPGPAQIGDPNTTASAFETRPRG